MNDIDTLFDTFFGNRGIGFERLYNRVSHVNPTNFPPHNIIKLNDSEMVLSLAVAGYGKDNIDVTVEDRVLKISGELPDDGELNYIHRGIAARKFTKSFALDEFLEVTGAEYVDGMLHVRLTYVVPEEKKPKKIPILSGTESSIKKLKTDAA